MNYGDIVAYLLQQGYRATLITLGNNDWIEIQHEIEGRLLKLHHCCVDELCATPHFLLENTSEHGKLAHVLPIRSTDFGNVCIGDQDSFSLNYDRPELVFAESLDRHIAQLTQAILDPVWNEKELLREFYSNWLEVCAHRNFDLLCAANGDLEEIKIYSPTPDRKWGFESMYFGITTSASTLAEFSYISKQNKGRKLAGDGFIIPLDNLMPAPSSESEVETWYLRTINKNHLPPAFEHKKGRRFWLIFNAETASGRTWFGINLDYSEKGKKVLPKKQEALKNWSITPIGVQIFNKDRLMPRSGADLDLDNKSILVVGCGSVGGEIVQKLGAAGVGNIVLCDPDIYSIDNIYRHVLSDHFIGCNKAAALSIQLETKYPWIKTKYQDKKLLDLRDKGFLEPFDLIVIAIGSPTHERLFHDFIVKNRISTPIVNTWLEGYGIGGHAVLDIKNTQGCLRCAYVDLQTDISGLSSNLNFLEPDQSLTINHAGCGNLFLPYNAISAAKTALIASDLIIGALLGKIKSSTKASWKGDDADVVKKGFSLTHRYTTFNKSFELVPLYNEECNLCHEE